MLLNISISFIVFWRSNNSDIKWEVDIFIYLIWFSLIYFILFLQFTYIIDFEQFMLQKWKDRLSLNHQHVLPWLWSSLIYRICKISWHLFYFYKKIKVFWIIWMNNFSSFDNQNLILNSFHYKISFWIYV